ncbi:hypothetical protein Cs7R123_08830 [Catellatospora sp. TT07R-123]|uniref:DUF948 domain-containing protein n=1 Tax=Catellatospora sp. TT07R-123 TaxID=2733863 RepID=UPI001B087237|nr:DUF948 domain-containing protein [Catellatospora sp. TT07R-123]GHJ43541.1 hypothetical protein Cs7R123_08830 [Catellatospora sp. TT07R-123]
MSGNEIAALIAAGAFALLVVVLAVPILRLRRTADAATALLEQLTAQTGPLLSSVTATVDNVSTTLGQVQVTVDGVNAQLAKVDTMTSQLATATSGISHLVGSIAGHAQGPLAKAAGVAFGLRRALRQRRS